MVGEVTITEYVGSGTALDKNGVGILDITWWVWDIDDEKECIDWVDSGVVKLIVLGTVSLSVVTTSLITGGATTAGSWSGSGRVASLELLCSSLCTGTKGSSSSPISFTTVVILAVVCICSLCLRSSMLNPCLCAGSIKCLFSGSLVVVNFPCPATG